MSKTNKMLWVIQGLLAALFLLAGGMKLVAPLAELAKMSPLPGGFMKLVGVAEVLGAIGLIMPSATRIRTGLTPLASCGLLVIMIGATVVTLATSGGVGAVVRALVGTLCAVVAIGRARWAPLGTERRMAALAETAVAS